MVGVGTTIQFPNHEVSRQGTGVNIPPAFLEAISGQQLTVYAVASAWIRCDPKTAADFICTSEEKRTSILQSVYNQIVRVLRVCGATQEQARLVAMMCLYCFTITAAPRAD